MLGKRGGPCVSWPAIRRGIPPRRTQRCLRKRPSGFSKPGAHGGGRDISANLPDGNRETSVSHGCGVSGKYRLDVPTADWLATPPSVRVRTDPLSICYRPVVRYG